MFSAPYQSKNLGVALFLNFFRTEFNQRKISFGIDWPEPHSSQGFVVKITDILEFWSIIYFQVKVAEQFIMDFPLPIFFPLEYFPGGFMASTSSSTKRCVIAILLMTQ